MNKTFDIALLKIIRNYYVKNQRKYSPKFISDEYIDFLDSIIEGLENL